MADAVYKISEIVGTSPHGVDEAIKNAVAKASETLRHLDWFEVDQIRGYLGGQDGVVDHFQVTLKIGFRMED